MNIKEKLRSFFDWVVVYTLYVFLRIRWIYFHIHPNYIKFYMDEKEAHFQNTKTGEVHSNITIHLVDGRTL